MLVNGTVVLDYTDIAQIKEWICSKTEEVKNLLASKPKVIEDAQINDCIHDYKCDLINSVKELMTVSTDAFISKFYDYYGRGRGCSPLTGLEGLNRYNGKVFRYQYYDYEHDEYYCDACYDKDEEYDNWHCSSIDDCNNCCMVVDSIQCSYCETVAMCRYCNACERCLECSSCEQCTSCYKTNSSDNCRDCYFCSSCSCCEECTNCLRCVDCWDCKDCHHCFDSDHRSNASYLWKNEQLTKDEWMIRYKEFIGVL